MFDLSQTVLIASFATCFLSLFGAIPLAAHLRRRSSQLGWNYGGLVRTEALGPADLMGLTLLLVLYTLMSALKLPQVTDWLISVGWFTEAPETVQLTPGVLIAGMISQAVPGAIVIVFLIFRQINIVEFFDLLWKKAPFILLIGPTVAVIVQILFVAMEVAGYSHALESIFGELKQQDVVRIYQEAHQVSIRILLAMMAVIIAPIVEEVVFRGYIYPVCKRYTGRIVATFVSSLFFSAVHFHIPALLPLFILAIALTIAYELSGSIWVPISIHACFNGFTLIMQELQPPS